MTQPGDERARRVAVADDPLLGADGADYADAFEIRRPEPDARSAEAVVRGALGRAPWWVRWTVPIVHRHLLRLQLGPPSSPDHILGWKVLASQPDVIHLEAVSPILGRAVLVGRRVDPTCASLTTYLFFARQVPARVIWQIVGPLHRRVVPTLLERSSPTGSRPTAQAGRG